jgi:hypothetical protein
MILSASLRRGPVLKKKLRSSALQHDVRAAYRALRPLVGW